MLQLAWEWQTEAPLQSKGWGWGRRGRLRWRAASPCSAGGPGGCRDPIRMRNWKGWRRCPGRTRGRTFWGWSWAWAGERLPAQSRSCPRLDWSWIREFAASLSSLATTHLPFERTNFETHHYCYCFHHQPENLQNNGLHSITSRYSTCTPRNGSSSSCCPLPPPPPNDLIVFKVGSLKADNLEVTELMEELEVERER